MERLSDLVITAGLFEGEATPRRGCCSGGQNKLSSVNDCFRSAFGVEIKQEIRGVVRGRW